VEPLTFEQIAEMSPSEINAHWPEARAALDAGLRARRE
jgi:hypothetical protein